jgi:predicted GH43/DUF377 family glycosyl hydrolase
MRKPGSRWKLYGAIAVAIAATATAIFSLQKLKPPAGSPIKAWKEESSNGLIMQGHTIPKMVWNDPSVLREGNTYRMWLSGGDPSDLTHILVQVYEARSTDGISWKISPAPVVPASPDPKAWDSLRIETPSVVKVGATYHMYYSAADAKNATEGIFAIGHATSPDGTSWTKDPANPVIMGQTANKDQWGYGGNGEPGVVYNPKDQTFYLYYTGMKYGPGNRGLMGILLATSKAGSQFTHYTDSSGARSLVLTRDVPDAIPGSWSGYSTPSAVITPDGRFHLFCAFVVAPKGPTTARHVTLDHAVSSDGKNFNVIEQNIFEAGKGDWKDDQVRSPSVVVEPDGRLKMWFAAEASNPFSNAGIGLAVRERP